MRHILFTLLLMFPVLGLRAQSPTTDGLAQDLRLGDFRMAPVPASDVLRITAVHPDVRLFVLLYDADGRNVLSTDLNGSVELNVSGLPEGAYMVATMNTRGTPLEVHRLLIRR